VDTGGVDIADTSPLTKQVAGQARTAIAEADLILFVVDTRAGITPGDEELAAILRHSHKPIFLIANKIDEPGREADALEFHRLGLGDPVPLSAVHGHGTGDLLDAIIARLPGSGPPEAGEDAIRVAILGRPNAGKSSLLNALLGEERVIVSEQPGTTRDSIDTVLAAADLKSAGRAKAVVAVGCLAERYGRELADSLPEADAVLGFDDYDDIADRLRKILAGGRHPAHRPRDRRAL